MSAANCPPSVGRPRCFDIDQALEQALGVFWRKGYEGTSLTDLTEAMGINKPSLYAAFGNKEQLFLKAIELYENRPCAFFYPALTQPTALAVAEFMLYGAARSYADSSLPQGCLVVQGALSCSEAAASVKQALITRRREGEQALFQRFEAAQQEGDLPADVNPKVLARYIGTVLQGMAIQATHGVSSDDLLQVARLALSNFPRPPEPSA
ncbi:TetR/AcrR family transcriptional regulator [Shewanella salipaludis]|uniref:TetR/AcrR family transcriptional regulator n=1 Tax=Shewanella salipaludis TaxID=2723052 RepID=A0A972JKU7_9GAMM|nr:TetR/AcrR family transcriptional regulator [Shewanella salipaludis]NMH66575.1 TetR/AcrR family transcriptional regulator [Shewanella salipaludis]